MSGLVPRFWLAASLMLAPLAFITLPAASVLAADSKLGPDLLRAVQLQDPVKVKSLLEQGADTDFVELNRSILGLAAQSPNVEIVTLLLDAKAKIEAVDGLGHTPLLRAIETERAPIVDVLLARGANANYVTPAGESALMLAVRSQKKGTVNALIQAGADVNFVNKDGESLALIAAQNASAESAEIIGILGAAKANLDISNSIYTPLYYAVQNSDEITTKALLDAGANPNVKTDGGTIPIHGALNNLSILGMLLSKKADPNVENYEGGTPLTVALETCNIPVAEALVKAGADVNKGDASHTTPLMYATSCVDTDFGEVLKEHGATK